MPYIGNQHNVGDHVNNFKVLDDISSYTATFDGSATSVVSTTAETIRIPEHRFIQGQRVTYNNGGGSNIGGLTSGTAYYVSFDSANTVKLATSLANANTNTVINLSTVGGGTSHTLNAAFDGVNTKFKLTFGSGNPARLNNATQINVAINNVIQRPNLDANNFTDGFALADNHKIVFKTAPTSQDIFWGSIIANTIENFDLRDNEVDNFTGNGSATEFTLSTIPANNESVIVTIDGVLQHPSDKDTTRAYTLIDSILQFTAAPALNAEIQARHIGFAGASTADVSGFYGRTGNVVLGSSDHITTGDITARNINASGILTAASASFGGNVSIGGTLTYEDVTNIDSVGVITARDGIKVGTGITFETNGQGTFSGIVTSRGYEVSYADSGPTHNLFKAGRIRIFDNGSHCHFRFGDHPSYAPHQHYSSNYVQRTNAWYLQNTAATRYGITWNNTDGPVHLYYSKGYAPDYSIKLSTHSSGINVTGVTTTRDLAVTGVSTFTGAIDASGGNFSSGVSINDTLSVQTINLSSPGNLQVSGISTFSGDIVIADSIVHTGDTDTKIRFPAANQISFETNGAQRMIIGTTGNVTLSNELRIPDSIAHQNDGDTKIRFPAADTISFETGGSERLRIFSDGSITQNYGNPNASATFKISKSGAGAAELRFDTAASNTASLYLGDDEQLRIRYGSTEHTRFASDGKVGIGTDAGYGDAKLTVEGTAALTNNDTTLQIKDNVNDSAAGRGGNIGFSGYVNGTQRTFAGIGGLKSSTGTGNFDGDLALYTRVNGQAELDERLRITSIGRVLVGATAARTVGGAVTRLLQVESTDGRSGISITRNSNDAGTPTLDFGKSRGNSVGSNVIVQEDDQLGVIQFCGSDGTDTQTEAAQIVGQVDGTPGSNDMPGRLVFKTTPDGSPTAVERLRITSGGNVGIGTNDPQKLLEIQHVGNRKLQFSYDDSIITIKGANNNGNPETIRLIGGNSIRFHTGATGSGDERLRITSTGAVGINTTNPENHLLELYTAASADWKFRIHTNVSDGAGFYQRANGDFECVLRDASNNNNFISGNSGGLEFATSGTEKLRITPTGSVGINSTSPAATLDIHDIGSTGPCLLLRGGSSTEGDIVVPHDEALAFGHWNYSSSTFTERLRIDSSGDVFPGADNDQDLGTSSKRWANVYSADLQLSNKGKTNDVDGTWGDFTIQEGESDLFLINNRNGKKYKFNLTEVT